MYTTRTGPAPSPDPAFELFPLIRQKRVNPKPSINTS
jgi:hypothetical protein